jgi:hypothetical protein
MNWMPTARHSEPYNYGAKQAILLNLHRGLLLASASRRLQDDISAQRATAEARHLLNAAKTLCEQNPDGAHDERIRKAIDSLTQALEQSG